MGADPVKGKIEWKSEGAYDGDNRRLACVRAVAVGAIFLGGRRVRWRVWVTPNMNPIEGTSVNEEAAKREVAQRYYRFLMLAGIISEEEWIELTV